MSGPVADAQHKHPENRAMAERHRRSRLVFWGFAVIAGVLLFTEHRAHLLGLLPYILLLACPLMHMFHHRHGSQHRRGGRDVDNDARSGERKP